MPPCRTKRRTTTTLKTKINQNCQKIELHGSPTTKDLKKNSSSLIGGVEMSSWGREDLTCKEVAAGLRWAKLEDQARQGWRTRQAGPTSVSGLPGGTAGE